MRLRVAILAALSLLMVGCDHASKHWAEQSLAQGSVDLVPGLLELSYTRNYDVAFSLLRSIPDAAKAPWLLSIGLGMITALSIWWWQRRRAPWSEQLAYALVLAGAVGNVVDRAVRGYVVDFIHLDHWPVFNVADVLLVGGGILLLLARAAPAPPTDPRTTSAPEP